MYTGGREGVIMNGRTARDDRLNLRASREQTEVIRLAAQISEATVTEFVLGSAVAAAERVLVDRRWFELDDANWVAFHAALDRPAVLKPRLSALLSEPDPFTG